MQKLQIRKKGIIYLNSKVTGIVALAVMTVSFFCIPFIRNTRIQEADSQPFQITVK